MNQGLNQGAGRNLPPEIAKPYIEEMLAELSVIAMKAGLSELHNVLSLARLVSQPDEARNKSQ